MQYEWEINYGEKSAKCSLMEVDIVELVLPEEWDFEMALKIMFENGCHGGFGLNNTSRLFGCKIKTMQKDFHQACIKDSDLMANCFNGIGSVWSLLEWDKEEKEKNNS